MAGYNEIHVSDVDPLKWSSIAREFIDYSYENSVSYSTAFARRRKATVQFLTVSVNDKIIGAASVRLKKFRYLAGGIAYISSGPLIHNDAPGPFDVERLKIVLQALLRKLVDEEKFILLVRLPATPVAQPDSLQKFMLSRGFKPTEYVRAYETVIVNLNLDEVQLRKNLHPKWRHHLNLSVKANLKIEMGVGVEYFQKFITMYESMKQRKEFSSGISPEFFFGLDQEDTGQLVFLAQHEGEYVGGHVLSLLGNTAIYLFGATNDAGREKNAGYFLHWNAMLYARQLGYRWYDLAGIDKLAYPGGYKFKSRTGGEIVRAVGPFKARPVGIVSATIDSAMALRHKIWK